MLRVEPKRIAPISKECYRNYDRETSLPFGKLDRLGRSLKHLVELVDQLNKQKVGLVSLNHPIDTTTSQGKLTFNIFASLAEFERDIISELTKAGLYGTTEIIPT